MNAKEESVRCRALCVSASGSNQGKTTITAGIAQSFRRRGKRVRVFKTGPDFLDPMILERASGNPVYQLDLWMNGHKDCARLLFAAAQEADLILIEGVMGLFDGKPSTADLSVAFQIPVLVVIDSGSMAQTFGAIAEGLINFNDEVAVAGVLANNVASLRHAQMLEEGIPKSINYLGKIFRKSDLALPSRHLGLVQADEISDLDVRLNAAADAIDSTRIEESIKEVAFPLAGAATIAKLLDGITIAIAQDRAFSFLYEANLQLLKDMGAQLCFFSPLDDAILPGADCVYLPGGYPELFLAKLSSNQSMRKALRAHFDEEKIIYAECGGMLYLVDRLVDAHGNEGQMLGILPGEAVMSKGLKSLGYQSAAFPNGTLKGHTFHHSSTSISQAPALHAMRVHDSSPGEPVYRLKGLTASYVHFYFPSNPAAAGAFFQSLDSRR